MKHLCNITYEYDAPFHVLMGVSLCALDDYAHQAFREYGQVHADWEDGTTHLDVRFLYEGEMDMDAFLKKLRTLPADSQAEGLTATWQLAEGKQGTVTDFVKEVKSKGISINHLHIKVVKLVPSFYILDIIEVVPLEYGHRQHYPKYKTQSYDIAYTETRKEAERLMHEYLEKRKAETDEWAEPNDIYCFRIREVPRDRLCHVADYVSWSIYDATGKRIDHSCCASAPFTEETAIAVFDGRRDEDIRFHKGDIVEVLNGDEVSLAVVMGTPLTREWCQQRPSPYRDETDDTYTVITGPGYEWHEHVGCQYVFAPHYPQPPYLVRRFKEYYEKATWASRVHDCATRNKEQIAQSSQCGCYACAAIFPSTDVTEYTDEGQTAICPKCGTDSIVGDASGFEITKPFLRKMRRKWFDY